MTSTLAERLIGTWELVSRIDRTAAGTIHPDPALGSDPRAILFYDAAGHFAAQFMKRHRSGDAVVTAVAGANNSRAVNGYDAYFGRYTIDERGGEVTQVLDGALAPDNVGMTVTRRMDVTGDELVIRLDTTAVDGTPVVRTLTWRRVG